MFVRWGSIGLGVVALAIGAFIFLGAQAVRPVEITGTVANYAEVSTSAGYDHNELRLTGDSHTYIVNRTTFQPALPDKFYLDGKVILWVNGGTEDVIALTLYDQHDQHPTNYSTPDYQHPYQSKENTRLLGAGVGGAGLILMLLGVIIPMILPGRKRPRQRPSAGYMETGGRGYAPAGPLQGAYAGPGGWDGYDGAGERWDGTPSAYGSASRGDGYDTGGYGGGGYDTGGYDLNSDDQDRYARDPYSRNDYGGEPNGPHGHGRSGYVQGDFGQGGYDQNAYGPPPGYGSGRHDQVPYGQDPYGQRAPHGPPPGPPNRGWGQPPAPPYSPNGDYGGAGGYGPPAQPADWGQQAWDQQAPWPPQPPPGRAVPPSGRRPVDPYDAPDQGGPPRGGGHGRSRPR